MNPTPQQQNRNIAKLPPSRQLAELQYKYRGGLFAGEEEREALKRIIYKSKQIETGLFGSDDLPEDDRSTDDLIPAS